MTKDGLHCLTKGGAALPSGEELATEDVGPRVIQIVPAEFAPTPGEQADLHYLGPHDKGRHQKNGGSRMQSLHSAHSQRKAKVDATFEGDTLCWSRREALSRAFKASVDGMSATTRGR